MWIQTHYYMAKQIHKHIHDKYCLDLPLDQLEYGSIKPDIHWSYIHVSHCYREGHSHWTKEVGQLLKDKKYEDINEFSCKLGIVLHFTADFFIYAHNNWELIAKLWKHVVYELKFHQRFIQFDHQQDINYYDYENAYSLIKNLRQRYLAADAGMENDIRFIYAASFLVADLMVEAVLKPTVNIA